MRSRRPDGRLNEPEFEIRRDTELQTRSAPLGRGGIAGRNDAY